MAYINKSLEKKSGNQLHNFPSESNFEKNASPPQIFKTSNYFAVNGKFCKCASQNVTFIIDWHQFFK